MSFTLTALKEAINEYTQNTNWGSATGDGTGQINAIIRQAEERINYVVQIANYNTKSTTGDLAVSGTSVTVDDSVTGPIAPIYFRIRAGADVAGNAWSYLLLKDYNFLQEYAPVDSATGTPKYYAFYNDAQASPPLNTGTFAFAPIASGAFDYEILYFFEPDSLITADASSTTRTCTLDETITVQLDSGTTAGIAIGSSVTGTGIASGTTVAGIGSTATTRTCTTATNTTLELTSGSTAGLSFGDPISGTNITAGTTIAGITDTDTLTMSAVGEGAGSAEITFGAEAVTLSEVATASSSGTELTFGNNLTWLSTHATNALLYACLVEAYTFLKGEADLMQLYDAKFKEALQTLVMTEQGNYRTGFRTRQKAA